MAANFPHMGGAGQMMPQQQAQPNPQQQQGQPQRLPNGAATQIQYHISQALKAQQPPRGGWQATVPVQERLLLIFNIIGNLRLASSSQPTPPTLQKMIEIGVKFEKDIFEKSPDKARYKAELQQKVEMLLEKRNQNQANLQQSVNLQAQLQAQAQQAQAQAQAHAHAQAQAQAQAQQMMMMNQNSMQGQVARMDQQGSQQGFHHLQQQMQPSPIPGQQAPLSVSMPNDGIPQNIVQNQQFQMPMQQQPQPPQNMPARPPNGQQLSQAEAAMVQDMTQRLIAQLTPENKNQLRADLQARMDAATFARYQSQGIDPIFMYYRNQAMQRLRMEKQSRMAQAQQGQLGIAGQQSQGMPAAAPPMQQQRSMNPSPLNGQMQQPAAATGSQDFQFIGNMGNLIDQQQQGVIAQEAGQMVVPASTAQRNATPQPGGVIPGQQMAMNDQRRVANPNLRAQQQQQQQQMFAQQQQQQQQQQRLQPTAQQQSQAAARANAQAKAQMALQGQPGGMGPGPMPPQQSPAMGTLNTPLRTPSQQGNNPEPPQVNPNAQFGQALDPRFMQGNQRQPAPANAVNAMLASMPPEQQQRFAALPPDKLNEVVNKWHEQRAMNAANGQVRPGQMPMQTNNQIRPGQQAQQPGQFNPQALSQFMATHPGQRPPPSLTAGMNPQQQQVLQHQLQQRMQQNAQQQRAGAPPTPADQRAIMQMDNMDIPAALLNHQQMPRGIPPDIKKWGVLKQWAQMSLPAEAQDTIRNLQRVHYQGILNSRAQQIPQQNMNVANAMHVSQAGNAMGPGGVPAPVAHMGPNGMPMANGMGMGPGQLRPITQQEIQAARAHPSGKMAALSDDQIRNILVRNQMNNQRQLQHKQQAMMQVQMANQMTPMDGQLSRPGVQQGQPQPAAPMGGAQKAPAAKQVSTGNDQTPSSATPNARARQPAGRGAGQSSSPAQPAKNLKRASSDDVIEVPNPNAPQPPAAPQNQVKAPPRLTEQQLAALSPEDRKKYDLAQRMYQAKIGASTEIELLRSIMQEEAQRRDPLPDIPMDQETKQSMLTLLREIQVPLSNVGRAVPKWFQYTRDTNRARLFFRARHRLQKQFKDPEMTQPRDTFSIQPTEVEQARVMLSSMVKDLSDRFPKMKKPDAGSASASQPAQPAAAAAAATAPLNAANLQQQQQQLNKLHQRTGNNRAAPAPAAPTSSQPPFQFGATSPHGAAKYSDTAPQLTQENLHIPARKKQRNNSSAPNAAGTTASPRTTKPVSPVAKRQQAPEAKPKPSLSCPEPECERLHLIFDTQEALKNHTEQEHVRPLADPAKYAHDKLASILEWDTQNKPKKAEDPAAAKAATPNAKSETTPAAAATPMNRQASTSTSKQGAATKGVEQAKANAADPKTSGKQEAKEADPWADHTIDPLALFQNLAPDSGALGAISDTGVYRSITPNDTPESSKDGVSEPNSDVSEGVALDINLDIFDDNWQPFGSDADFLADMTSLNNLQSGQDLTTLEDDPSLIYTSWDDMIDVTALDKPFQFDNSLFSMNME